MVFATYVHIRPFDVHQIVHHGNYGPWLEIGRTELFSQVGISYGSMEQDGVSLAMSELWMSCKPFKKAATVGDLVLVLTTPEQISNDCISFAYEIRSVGSSVVPEGRLSDEQLVSIKAHSSVVVSARSKHEFLDRNEDPVLLDQVAPGVYERLRDSFPNLVDA